jgi:Xylose isomerase-like TIM barrel
VTIRSPRAQIAESVKGDPVGSSPVGVKILFDTYHLTNNGEDLPASIRRFAGQIGHVQVADSPGRGEPGTGAINFPSVIKGLGAALRGMIARLPGRPPRHSLLTDSAKARVRSG